MCMRTRPAPRSATSAAISGSPRSAVTSLTIVAPASSAASATAAFEVSTEIVDPEPGQPRHHRLDPAQLLLDRDRAAPGRVDSPPTSRMSAPCAASSRPCEIAASGSRYSPPSENESGVTFTTPINFTSMGSITDQAR